MMIPTMIYPTHFLANSPSKAISTKLQNHLDIDHGKKHSFILLDYHLKICHQIFYPKASA
jgi:hypothetical protein